MKKLIALAVLAALAIGGVWAASLYGRDNYLLLEGNAFEALDRAIGDGGGPKRAGAEAELPPFVRAYLEKAIGPNQPSGSLMEVTQSGKVRMSADSSWDAFRARQRMALDRPMMVLSAEVEYLPLTPVMTLTTLLPGKCMVESFLWGSSGIFDNSGQGLRRYLMTRWLAEAVWHPRDLLPGGPVTWSEQESKVKGVLMARARLTAHGDTVEGVFLFPAGGGAPMIFLGDPEPGGPFAGQRWYCEYSQWQNNQGDMVPYAMTQGMRRGIGDDMRLRLSVERLARHDIEQARPR